MTITAPEPDPDAPEHDDPRALSGAAAGSSPRRLAVSGGAGERVRWLRLAPAVQLELVCDRESPRPEAVWASLPQQARETVLIVLARLIGAGAIEREDEA